MALGKHQRTKQGTFRKERDDSKIGNLKKEYPILASIDSRTKLGTIKKELGVNSLSKVLKKLKN